MGEGPDAGTDYVSAFKMHKARHGITSDNNGALAMHLLVIVSPEWLAQTGDPRDWRGNLRVSALTRAAKDWAEDAFGAGSVFAVRYDTDEEGAGVVDVLCAPIRADGRSKKRVKHKISVAKASKELADRHGRKLSWTAMQDSWSAYAQRHLSPELRRGEETANRKHLSPEEYKAKLAAEADQRAAAETLKEVQARLESPFEIPVIEAPSLAQRLAPDAFLEAVNRQVKEAVKPLAARAQAYDQEKAARNAAEKRAQDMIREAERATTKLTIEQRRASVEAAARVAAERKARDLQADLERERAARKQAEDELDRWPEKLPLAEVAEALELEADWDVPGSFRHLDGRQFVLHENGAWEEPTENRRGRGAIEFVARVLRISLAKATDWLCRVFGAEVVAADAAATVFDRAPPEAEGMSPGLDLTR